MILEELMKVNTSWAQNAQPSIAEAVITKMGNKSDTYSIQFRNGTRINDLNGPAGLSLKDVIVVASYPGRVKKYVILGKSDSGSTSTTETVYV